MPILKVSETLEHKQGYSGMRIPVVSQPIDNCPQCGVGGYRDGICQNATCGFLDPKLEAAYQEYSMATMVQQQAMADKAAPTKKSASAEGQTPVAIIDQFSQNSEKVKKDKCNVCRNMSIVNGSCETQGCYGSLPPEGLRTPSSKFTGINEKTVKNKGPRFLPTFEVFNSRKKQKPEDSKKPTKKIKAVASRIEAADKQQQMPVSPGMFLDSSMILPKQPVVRMQEALQLDATMKSEKPFNAAMDQNNTDKNTSEELQ